MRPFTVPAGNASISAICEMGEAAEVGQLDHLPLLGGQLPQCAPHVLGLVPTSDLGIGVLGRPAAARRSLRR